MKLHKRALLGFLELTGMTSTVWEMRGRLRYLRDHDVRERNRRFIPPDGLPMPPPRLVFLVVGHFDYGVFFRRGEARLAYILEILRRGGVDPDGLTAVLDWGCGCGRVLRHWRQLPNVQPYGSDYNDGLVAWCRNNLPFARVATNGLAPPLAYPDDSFDFLYAISVFTHLDEPLQTPWMDELRRVVKPGGHILITVNGVRGATFLIGDERDRYARGELVLLGQRVFGERHSGENLCNVVHPDAYVRNVLAKGLEVIVAAPVGTPGIDDEDGDDGYLLRVPD